MRGWEWRFLWQHSQSDALFQLEQYDSMVFNLAFSRSGNHLAVGLWDGRMVVWEFSSRRRVATFKHAGQIVALAFSSHGELLASASKRGDLRVFKGPDFDYPISSFEAGAALAMHSVFP